MLEVAYRLTELWLLEGLFQAQSVDDLYQRLAVVLAKRTISRCRQGVFAPMSAAKMTWHTYGAGSTSSHCCANRGDHSWRQYGEKPAISRTTNSCYGH